MINYYLFLVIIIMYNMVKKKLIEKGLESFTFKIFLKSLTLPKIKELINRHNDSILEENIPSQKFKGYSKLRKNELIDELDSFLVDHKKSFLYNEFEKDFSESIIFNALSLISGEHKVEKIQNAAIIAGGKGYNVWYSSKYGSKKASLKIVEGSVERDCSCKIGRKQSHSKVGGLCLHQMAIYLMLIGKKIISSDDLPFNIDKGFFESVIKRLDLLATQNLFKEDPAIMLEGDYKIYIHDDLVTLDWGGKYAGKSTKDISKEKEDVETWVIKKVVSLILKDIKVKAGTGKPTKILIDNYDIISNIMKKPDQVDKILKKFSVLNDLDLPKSGNELEKYLRNNLIEKTADLSIEPPFSAYMGDLPYVFVSYTHKDKAEVYPILQKLNTKGINIWYDEGIPLSRDWCNTIAEKLIECRVFLSVISPNVLESENTQDEIHLAVNEKKPFLTIYLKDTELNPGLKMRIRRMQGIMKYEMNENRFFEKLTQDLSELIS